MFSNVKHQQIRAGFIASAAILSLIVAIFPLMAFAVGKETFVYCSSFFRLSNQMLLYVVSGAGLILSAFLLIGQNSKLKLLLLSGLGAGGLAYQVGTAYLGNTNLYVCLASLADWGPLSPRILNRIVFINLGLLLLGSVGLLAWGRVGHTKDAQNTDLLSRTLSSSQGGEEEKGGRKQCTPLARLLVGWGLGVLLALVFLSAVHIHAWLVLPPQLDVLAEQSFYRSGVHGKIVGEPSGNGLFYLQDLDDDLNAYRVDRASGDRRRLSRLNDVVGSRFFTWIGWAPDRCLMAYSTKKENKEQQLVLRDGLTGKFRYSFEISSCGVVKEGVWLDTNSLVLLNVTEGLWLFNLEAATNLGQFGKKGLVRLRFPSGHKHRWLTADSDHSFAFVWKNDVWRLDIPNNRLEALTHFTNGSASELCFDARTGTYLFSANIGGNTRDWHLYSYRPASGSNAAISRLLATPASNAKWAQGTNSVACTLNADNTNYFAVIDFTSGFQTNLFPAKCVNDFSISPDGNRVYAVALDEDAMWRIWEYDIGTKSLRKNVPKEENGPILRKMLPPILASLTNAEGKKVEYYCVPPVNIQPGKRYPVFMDLYSPNSFDDAVQFIANAGIYYVSPNRFGITDWRTVPEFENVLAVYEELLKNPNIDPQRIYLASVSKSTALASELVNAFPEKWRGVILQNPTAAPQIPANPTRYPRIFISIGDMELPEPRALVDNLMLDACRCLLPVHLDVQHSRHVHPKPQLKRCYLAMAKFILTDN